MEKKNLLKTLETTLQRRKVVNSLNIGTDSLNIDASFEYLKDISLKINTNSLDMITQICLIATSIDHRIQEEEFKIFPHEFDNQAELLAIIFGKLTTHNRKIGQKIEALRNQLNLFGDDYE